jgi:hypothetical protein
MAQEDILKREIDKMARALTSILLSLAGKNMNDVGQVMQYANEMLKSELDFDLTELAEIPNDDLIQVLAVQRKLNNGHLGILADIIFNSAKATQPANPDLAKQLFQKAAILYKHLSLNDKNYNFEWHDRIIAIDKIV